MHNGAWPQYAYPSPIGYQQQQPQLQQQQQQSAQHVGMPMQAPSASPYSDPHAHALMPAHNFGGGHADPHAAAVAADDVDVSHTPEAFGYAMIITDSLCHVLRSKHLQIGRHMSGGDKPGMLGISGAKNISRVHATLHFEPALGEGDQGGAWMVTCLGKNGMHHQGVFQAANSSFQVHHKDRLQIGDTPFYFIEPIPMSTQHVLH